MTTGRINQISIGAVTAHTASKRKQASIYAPIGVGFDHVLRLILKKSVVSTGLCDFHTHMHT